MEQTQQKPAGFINMSWLDDAPPASEHFPNCPQGMEMESFTHDEMRDALLSLPEIHPELKQERTISEAIYAVFLLGELHGDLAPIRILGEQAVMARLGIPPLK